LSPSSQYLYVAGTSTANASNGSISGFMEDPTSGDLSSTSGTPYIDSNSPLRGIAVDPTQQFVFATSSSHDWILAYTIAGGSLTQVINNPFSTLQGSPYGIVASPLGNASGGFVFATNPSTASVSVLSYDNNGNLSVISGSPYLTGNQPEGIAIDPTGKYLYVTNFADNTISSFSVNAQSGALTLIGTVGTGNGPIGVQVDPSGQFVYVANQTDGSVSLFTTNAGTLTAGPTYAAGSGAIAVGIE
jgi:DNA-binding beta-propeller fold protein YncE